MHLVSAILAKLKAEDKEDDLEARQVSNKSGLMAKEERKGIGNQWEACDESGARTCLLFHATQLLDRCACAAVASLIAGAATVSERQLWW